MLTAAVSLAALSALPLGYSLPQLHQGQRYYQGKTLTADLKSKFIYIY
jgi:hypothetical protein